jgi:hypothetical protein
LSHDLGTERAHAESGLHTTLSQAKRLRIEHPFIGSERIVLTVDNKSKVTEVILALAFNEVGGSREALLLESVRSEGRHRHERGTRVESDEAALRFILADVEGLTINLDIIKLDTEHVLQLNVVPVNVSRELGLVVVTEGQVRLLALRLILRRGKVESEHVALKQVLGHHLIEDGSDARLSKGRVSETND